LQIEVAKAFGRNRELEDGKELLANNRLVVLTGTGASARRASPSNWTGWSIPLADPVGAPLIGLADARRLVPSARLTRGSLRGGSSGAPPRPGRHARPGARPVGEKVPRFFSINMIPLILRPLLIEFSAPQPRRTV
jgi:hypothetical protein